MKRSDIKYDESETDVEELQEMVSKLVALVDDTEERVCSIKGLLEITTISDMGQITDAYDELGTLEADLY